MTIFSTLSPLVTDYLLPICSSIVILAYFITYWTRTNEDFRSDARTCLLTRRSIDTYDMDRVVPNDLIQRAVEAAILAPNHHLTEPWRYYNCGPVTIDAMAGYLDKIDPKAALRLRSSVPHIMVVTQASRGVVWENDTVTEIEDRAAVAASVQNFMLSLHADGVATKWITGAMMIPDNDMLQFVGADPETERLVASVWYGYPLDPADPPAPKRQLGVDGILTELS